MKKEPQKLKLPNQIQDKQNLLDHQKQKLEKEEKDDDKSLEDDREYQETINKIRHYSSEQFDKQIVYLAGGGLVFTVGFVKDIVTITETTEKTILILSWIFLGVALISNLLSHKTSIISMDLETKGKHKKSDTWSTTTEVLNYVSIFTLILGIIFFIIFVSKNI